jgi:transposase-like protein
MADSIWHDLTLFSDPRKNPCYNAGMLDTNTNSTHPAALAVSGTVDAANDNSSPPAPLMNEIKSDVQSNTEAPRCDGASSTSDVPPSKVDEQPAVVSDDDESDEPRPSNPQFAVAIAALAQLAAEPNDAHRMFIRFAGLSPRPSAQKFAKEHGIHRNTMSNWKRLYRWNERLKAYYDALAGGMVASEFHGVQVRSSQTEKQAVLDLDLRIRSLDIARSAMESWLANSDQPTTVQGVVRAFELALKLNPPAPAPNTGSRSPREELGMADFLARIKKCYGPEARAAHAARVAAAFGTNGEKGQ